MLWIMSYFWGNIIWNCSHLKGHPGGVKSHDWKIIIIIIIISLIGLRDFSDWCQSKLKPYIFCSITNSSLIIFSQYYWETQQECYSPEFRSWEFFTISQMKFRGVRRNGGRSGWRDGGGAKKEEKYKTVHIWSNALPSGGHKASRTFALWYMATPQAQENNRLQVSASVLSQLNCNVTSRSQYAQIFIISFKKVEWTRLHTETESCFFDM